MSCHWLTKLNSTLQAKTQVIVVCAKFEEELATLESDEAEMFKQELGLSVTGLQKLITAGYDLLGLISYLTAGERKCVLGQLTKEQKAPQAAGKNSYRL